MLNYKDKYKKLKIRYAELEAKYYRLKAKHLRGITPKEPESVSKEKYYKLMAKYRKCRAQLIRKQNTNR